MERTVIYLTDKQITTPPEDAKLIVYLSPVEVQYFEECACLTSWYWTPNAGEQVQMWYTENLINTPDYWTWKLITDDPAKYTNMVSSSRFVLLY